jgi:hypothetical protein
MDLTGVRRVKTHNRAPQSRLATPGFTNHTEGFPDLQVEADIIDRFDKGPLSMQPAGAKADLVKQAAGDIKVLIKIFN